MKILYITVGSIGNLSAGSGLRPSCMYRAFTERGHSVYLLSGHDGRGEGKLRAADVEKAKRWVLKNKPDLCYIESTTYPMLHRCDYGMMRFLHNRKIPTGYFYRDFYRRFPDLFPRRRGALNALKETYLDIMQFATDRILRLADIIYFPSEACFPYFSYRNMRALPPAGEERFGESHEKTNTCIYVGGILAGFYGFSMLLEAFRLLNMGDTMYRLILVCREAEYAVLRPETEPEWLEVHHVSGAELDPLYARADVGLLTLTKTAYSDLDVGTKLFQYLSFGLPVLSTDVKAMHSLICENGFGQIAPFDAQGFADTLRTMLNDPVRLRTYRDDAVRALTQKHLWVHRVDQVVSDLLDGGQ